MKKITCLLFTVLAVFAACKKEPATPGTPVASAAPERYVRKNAHSPEAVADLVALDKAIGIMKSKGCDDPLSWYYQGAIHWVPNSIIGENKLCDSYQNDSQLKPAWDNCTHSKSHAEEIHFLVWHRMYIYHFEKIVRKLSGKSDFALPYWGYTNTQDSLKNRTLPDIFRDKKSNLYQFARLDSLLNGSPISGETTRALSLTKLNENNTYALYNQSIDAAPHGAMHDYIGFGNDTVGKYKFNEVWQRDTNGMMAEVATAAFDPIFWLHHSNIDRIWQQWTNSDNGKQVLLEELQKVAWKYVFFDENGNKVEYTTEEVVDMLYTMDYDFDDTKVQPKTAEKAPLVFSSKNYTKGDTLSISSKKIALNKDVKISLGNTKGRNVKLLTESNKQGEILLLSVTVSFVKAPKGSFEVYLNQPVNVKATPENDNFAGFMTFFGADHAHHGGGAGNGRITKTFTFEITDEAVDTKAMAKNKFDISILKFNGSRADDIQIEKVSVLKQ
ncbi:MAG: hypothetical protein DI539_12125 [Flavobacterium psychrophilum]|nr:MAG: hypothetical protein DI539_12125 [Flavobacterium psychrophilum]